MWTHELRRPQLRQLTVGWGKQTSVEVGAGRFCSVALMAFFGNAKEGKGGRERR